MAAIMAILMALHLGLHCWRRGVVVTAERHAGRGKSLQWKPQQQKTEDEIAQAVLHDFFVDCIFLVRLLGSINQRGRYRNKVPERSAYDIYMLVVAC